MPSSPFLISADFDSNMDVGTYRVLRAFILLLDVYREDWGLRQEIETQAYQLFEERNYEHGHDLDDWLLAKDYCQHMAAENLIRHIYGLTEAHVSSLTPAIQAILRALGDDMPARNMLEMFALTRSEVQTRIENYLSNQPLTYNARLEECDLSKA